MRHLVLHAVGVMLLAAGLILLLVVILP